MPMSNTELNYCNMIIQVNIYEPKEISFSIRCNDKPRLFCTIGSGVAKRYSDSATGCRVRSWKTCPGRLRDLLSLVFNGYRALSRGWNGRGL